MRLLFPSTLVSLAVHVLLTCTLRVTATVVDWEDFGAVPGFKSFAQNNTLVLNIALATLSRGDELFISNKTFWLAGGVRVRDHQALHISIFAGGSPNLLLETVQTGHVAALGLVAGKGILGPRTHTQPQTSNSADLR